MGGFFEVLLIIAILWVAAVLIGFLIGLIIRWSKRSHLPYRQTSIDRRNSKSLRCENNYPEKFVMRTDENATTDELPYSEYVKSLQINPGRVDIAIKTINVCLILSPACVSGLIDYLKMMARNICANKIKEYPTHSIRKTIDTSICSYLDHNNIENNKPAMFYDDAFFLVSYMVRRYQEQTNLKK